MTDLPFKLEIPTPIRNVQPRGRHATSAMGKIAKYRTTHVDYARIETAARIIGITPGEFMRQTILATLLEIQGHVGEDEWNRQLRIQLSKMRQSDKAAILQSE